MLLHTRLARAQISPEVDKVLAIMLLNAIAIPFQICDRVASQFMQTILPSLRLRDFFLKGSLCSSVT